MAESDVMICSWDPRFRDAFAKLNLAWLERYFEIEPHDRELLSNPEGEIIRGGGDILFALLDDRPVGTVALVKHSDGVFELTKMAVDSGSQGQGVGRQLLTRALERARALRARQVWLESHSSLVPALKLYEAAGFRHVRRPVASRYRRADVYMEWSP